MFPTVRRRLGVMLSLAVAASLTVALPARAQNAYCDLLTSDEVGGALGGPVTPTADAGGCTWATAEAGDAFVFLSTYWDDLPYEERREAFSTGTAMDLGGREAWYVEDFGALYIPLDQGVLVLQAVASGEGIDLATALAALGELVVERGPALPTPEPQPTPVPMPSFESVAELEALFPQTIAGEALVVQSLQAEQLFALATEDEANVATRQRIEDALAAQGKTLADLSLGFGGNVNGSVQAVRVAGGDAAALTDLFLSVLNEGQQIEQRPGQVAGKDVIIATVGPSTQVAYPKDDILWLVQAEEPALTEILQALP